MVQNRNEYPIERLERKIDYLTDMVELLSSAYFTNMTEEQRKANQDIEWELSRLRRKYF